MESQLMLWKPYNKEYILLAVPASLIKYFQTFSTNVTLKWLTEFFHLLCKYYCFSTISLHCVDIKTVFSTIKGRNANWTEALEAELRTLSILGRVGSSGGWSPCLPMFAFRDAVDMNIVQILVYIAWASITLIFSYCLKGIRSTF